MDIQSIEGPARHACAIWLCGAGSKKLGRGYAGNINALHVADEAHLRLKFADAKDFLRESEADISSLPMKDLMVRMHAQLAERCTGLAFVRLSGMMYSSLLDNLTPEQRVTLLGLGISVKQAAFDAAGNLCFLPRTAFQIPLGLCYLASHLSWRSLALVPNSKWDADCDAICLHQEVRYFADRCQFQGSAIADFVAPSVLQPSNQLFTALAEDLCQWASSIVSASEDPELTTNDLEQYVIWLNSLREASSSKRRTADHQWEKQTSSSFSGRAGGRGAFNPSTGTRGRYRTMFLIQCLLFALHLKESSSVARALRRAFAILPDYWCKTLETCFSMESIPSAATVSRARLYLDTAFMGFMRKEFSRLIASDSVFFLLMDSSPQGFQNWMMAEVFGIEGSELLKVMSMFFDCCEFGSSVEAGDLEPDASELSDFLDYTEQIRGAALANFAFLLLEDVQAMLSCTHTYTSDMGTESGFNLATVSLQGYFPYWLDNSSLSFDFVDDGPAAVADACDSLELPNHVLHSDCARRLESISLEAALYVPGIFHIIDNATKDILKKSLIWETTAHSMLDAVLLFFNATHRRTWFVARCCTGRFRGWEMSFQSASPKLDGGRTWGVVSAGVAWVQERKIILQNAWDSTALISAPDNEHDQHGQESGKLVQRVDEAIRDPLFWAFLDLCSLLMDLLDRITSWTQGCACHSSGTLRNLLRPLLRGSEPISCPMRGRRAAEMACGELHELLESLFSFNDSQIALVHTAGLPDAEKTRLLLDWSAMKVHLRMQFDLKLSPWRHLPLKALCLGHWNLQKARAMLWECFVDWENMPEQLQASAHPQTRMLFLDLRTEVQAFLRDEHKSCWPRLQKLRAKAAFTSVLEQSIERRHAILHQHLKSAPCHSAAFVSLCERKQEILDRVTDGKGAALAEICETTRTAPLVADMLGLSQHPAFASYHVTAAERLDVGVPHTLVCSVVYRCDIHTQYASLPKVQKPPRDPKYLPLPPLQDTNGDGGSIPSALVREPGSEAAPAETESASSEFLHGLREFHAWQHLSATGGSSQFFSIAPRQALPVSASELMLPLQEALARTSNQDGARGRKLPLSLCDGPKDVVVDFEFQEDSGAVQASSASLEKSGLLLQGILPSETAVASASGTDVGPVEGHTFFRVIAGAPAGKKLARTDAGVELRPEHMVIQKCAVHHVNKRQREVGIEVDQGRCQPELMQRPASLNSCLLWNVARAEASFAGNGKALSPEEQAALDQLLEAGATAADAGLRQLQRFELSAHSQQFRVLQQGLQSLQAAGLASSLQLGAKSTAWTLTAEGLGRLCHTVVLHSPVRILELPAVPQLMARLQENGFELVVRDRDIKAEPVPFNAHTEKPKKWYAREKTFEISRDYLVALLSPDTVRKHGHSEVRHLQKASFYKELLGQPARRRRLQSAGKGTEGGDMVIVGDAGDALEDLAPAQKEKRAKTQRARHTGAVRERHAQAALPDAADGDGDGVGDEAAAGGPPAHTRSVHPKSFSWGAAMITFKAPRSYQVRCPRICTHRHASGKITACTKTRSFSTPEEEALVIRQLKFWVSQARDYSSRKDHMEKCPFLQPPCDEELEAAKLGSDYETEDEHLRPVAKRRPWLRGLWFCGYIIGAEAVLGGFLASVQAYRVREWVTAVVYAGSWWDKQMAGWRQPVDSKIAAGGRIH
ncbi:hypothetical protein AK812_SmicGene18941 [Symbiodinium microadriaticum]|uniref:Uncharacterized protein n=1 Tax=Symbiodinium microadriaticum TaxID=2951 RepID=A0A1Q9DTW6_SYMMI|nr:hypothetical protein AK812_SmicGene18941 [Symbiodinium microadriaticum]